MKKLILATVIATLTTACSDADVASRNLSTAAAQFELDRRVVFYNGITNEYILTILGRCAVTNNGEQLAVTCKTGTDEYKMHYLGLSDNVTYFSEQLAPATTGVYSYRVIFKPSVIIPDPELH